MEHARGTPALVQSGFPPRSELASELVHRLSTCGDNSAPRLVRQAAVVEGSGSYTGRGGTRTEVRRRRRPPDRDEGAYAPVPASNESLDPKLEAVGARIQGTSATGATTALDSIRSVLGATRKRADSVPAVAHTHW